MGRSAIPRRITAGDPMSTKKPVDYLTIRGFKSIKSMDRLKLENLNVLIGANGSGKSNFVSYFKMCKGNEKDRIRDRVFLE